MKITRRQLRRIIHEAGESENEKNNRMRDVIEDIATGTGKDWASDSLFDAKDNPSMWQGQHDSAEDYVISRGQDAAMDLADSIIGYGEPEIVQYFKSLPRRAPSRGLGWGRGHDQTQFREFVADVVYDGIVSAIKGGI